MKVVIFLGPTLPVSEARQILDAVYLPPVKQSDLISAAARYKSDVIGIIDGVFSQSLSVWHRAAGGEQKDEGDQQGGQQEHSAAMVDLCVLDIHGFFPFVDHGFSSEPGMDSPAFLSKT